VLRVEAYKAEHLATLDLQQGQQYIYTYLSPELRQALESKWSYSALDGDEVVCCAGLIEFWSNRAVAWAYLSENITPRRFVVIHKMVQRFLDACPFDRVEAAVDVYFEPGHRWVEALGFTLEAPSMRKFRPDGGASALYARVRG